MCGQEGGWAVLFFRLPPAGCREPARGLGIPGISCHGNCWVGSLQGGQGEGVRTSGIREGGEVEEEWPSTVIGRIGKILQNWEETGTE